MNLISIYPIETETTIEIVLLYYNIVLQLLLAYDSSATEVRIWAA